MSLFSAARNANVFAALLLLFGAVHAQQSSDPVGTPSLAISSDSISYEPEILVILEQVNQGQLSNALELVDQHLSKFPRSRIAHLIRADVLSALSAPLSGDLQLALSAAPNSSAYGTATAGASSEEVLKLRHQIRNRWRHDSIDKKKAQTLVPASLVDMGRHKYVLVSDMKAGRLYLYKNEVNQPVLVRDYYLSVGSQGYGKEVEGDNKTPVGVYFIYRHIAGKELPDLYGKGAYPINYPNRIDKSKKRTGYGIWLHGTPSNTYARSPWASEGCFVLSNQDLLNIEQYIDVEARTPVVLTDGVDWVSLDQLQERRLDYHAAITQWKSDWESLNMPAYMSHYSKSNFNLGKGGFSQWEQKKRSVNRSKTFIQIDMEIEDLFVYPGERDMFVVRYTQRYLSNNFSSQSNKEQYWQRDSSGQWKIIFEG